MYHGARDRPEISYGSLKFKIYICDSIVKLNVVVGCVKGE